MVLQRGLFIAIIAAVALILAAANVAAAEKVVKVNRISAVQDSATIVVVSLEAKQKLTDARLTVSVDELGLRARRNVDFSKSGKKAVHVELPVPGIFDPYVKIVFNSDEGRRVKYRPLLPG